MMLQIGRMMGNLVTHNILTPSQTRCLIASAALKETWCGMTCMDHDDLPRHLRLAVDAGQHEAQLTMQHLAQSGSGGKICPLDSVTSQP